MSQLMESKHFCTDTALWQIGRLCACLDGQAAEKGGSAAISAWFLMIF